MRNRPRNSPKTGRSGQSPRASRQGREGGAPPRSGPSPRTGGGQTPRVRIDLYGHHAVREAILNPDRHISAIFAAEGAGDEILDHVDAARTRGLRRPDVHLVPRSAFDAALPRDAVHQGVGLTCDPLPDVGLEDILRDLGEDAPAVFVMLDQVTDPHNMGAIIRSACAFGAAGLIVQRRHAPEPGALMAKTACGALEHLPLAYETNLSRALETLKEQGFTAIALDERGDIDLPEFIPPARSVLVLGAEGPGLRRLVREGCDRMIRLPTNEPIGSLNVSNAAAVALYHLTSIKR